MVFTDTLGIAQINLPGTAQSIRISTFTKPKGFYITIADRRIPSIITIVWGSIEYSPSTLTLCSKVPLEYKELKEISNSLFMGNHIDSELYYYFFNNE